MSRRLLICGVLAALAGIQYPAAAARAISFSPPVAVAADAREPTLQLGPRGVRYIVTGLNGGIERAWSRPNDVFRSDDRGRTWTRTPQGVRNDLPGGGNAALAVDPRTGKLFMADLWDADTTVSTSSDRGETWLANPVQGVLGQHQIRIVSAGNGVIYYLTNNYALGQIVAKSYDGLVFPFSTVAVTPTDQEGIGAAGALIVKPGTDALGRTDRVAFIYATGAGGIKFARSDNGGLTFASRVVSPDSAGQSTQGDMPVVAQAGGDRLVALWSEVAKSRVRVMLATSDDWGTSWSPKRTIVDTGTPFEASMDARGTKVAISLYSTDAAAVPDTVPADAHWYETYLESTDGGQTFSTPVIVDPQPVKIGHACTQSFGCYANAPTPTPTVPPISHGPGRPSASACDATGDFCDVNRELANRQSVVIEALGRANIAWTRSIDNKQETEIRFARQR